MLQMYPKCVLQIVPCVKIYGVCHARMIRFSLSPCRDILTSLLQQGTAPSQHAPLDQQCSLSLTKATAFHARASYPVSTPPTLSISLKIPCKNATSLGEKKTAEHTGNRMRYARNVKQLANMNTACRLTAYESLAARWRSGGRTATRVAECRILSII